jgi:hypothetical protein
MQNGETHMTRSRITFTDTELDIIAYALVCFDIGHEWIGAKRWWDDDDTLWLLQKMCKMGEKE